MKIVKTESTFELELYCGVCGSKDIDIQQNINHSTEPANRVIAMATCKDCENTVAELKRMLNI